MKPRGTFAEQHQTVINDKLEGVRLINLAQCVLQMYIFGIKSCIIVFVPHPFFKIIFIIISSVNIKLKIIINILDPNYSNMVRNGGTSVSDMLADSQLGLKSWMLDNLDGCNDRTVNRAVSISIPILSTLSSVEKLV